MYSLNSIKGKLLIAFLFLTLIMISLSGSSFWFSQKGQKILYKKDLIALIHKNILQLFTVDLSISHENFLKEDSIHFITSYYKKRTIVYTDIKENINLLWELNKSLKVDIDEDLSQLSSLIILYNLKYQNYIISKTSFEKDSATHYYTNAATERSDITDLKYNENNKPLYLLQDEIEHTCEIIKNKIFSKHRKSQHDEKLIFSISVIYSILLSIFLSLFTASRISKPFKILSEVMDSSHNLKVNKKIFQKIDQSSNEVKILVTSFENLLNEISCQLEIIKEKSEVLENQNQKLQISEKNLNESNKVKDKFFSILAHDLRGPFVTIQSFLEILINHTEGFTKNEITQLAKEMSITIEGISGLLENLLEWSRSQKGSIEYTPSSINLREVIQKNIQIINVHAANKKIKILTKLNGELSAYADYNMVDFVLRNLLSNAIKFTSFKGEVIIECGDIQDFVEISIIDNGIGISMEDQQKLFRNDFQFSKMGTSKEMGTGLGLLLCKEFIEKCSGKITMESVPEKGTTFKFTLQKKPMLVTSSDQKQIELQKQKPII